MDQEQRIVQPLESSFASLPEVRELSSGDLSTVASPPGFITTTKASVHKGAAGAVSPMHPVAGASSGHSHLVNSYHQQHRSSIPPSGVGPVTTISALPLVPGVDQVHSGSVFGPGGNIVTTRAPQVGPISRVVPPPLTLRRKDSDPLYAEMLAHQSRSLPTGPPIPGARINRTPSISSQGNIYDNFVRKVNVITELLT